MYDIYIIYFNFLLQQSVWLLWQSDGVEKELIPILQLRKKSNEWKKEKSKEQGRIYSQQVYCSSSCSKIIGPI